MSNVVEITDLSAWLNKQTDFQWLLAHFYDGVVWGRYQNGKWNTSAGEANSPVLETDMLLELRLFSETQELYLWRAGSEFRSRVLKDEDQQGDHLDEEQLLWGTRSQKLKDGLVQLEDGRQGLNHVMPLGDVQLNFGKNEDRRPVSLTVRHYIEKDEETGLALIQQSRLVAVSVNGHKLEEK